MQSRMAQLARKHFFSCRTWSSMYDISVRTGITSCLNWPVRGDIIRKRPQEGNPIGAKIARDLYPQQGTVVLIVSIGEPIRCPEGNASPCKQPWNEQA